MKLKDLLIAGVAAVIVGGAVLVWIAPWEGERAPNVQWTTLDGETVQLADLRGKPTIIAFWATTCVTCVQEIPHFAELYEELAPRGLQFVAVAMEYDPPNQVQAMVKAREMPYPVAMDQDGSVAKAFGDVRLTPTTVVIGPNGEIVQRRLGMMDMERLRERLERMLPADGAA
ncbi:peroxiredoxin [Natronocella acetinitrilica]|uniref:Peroxiredoxin n=1 Tax=Natronocella acetinitrilica TaxID=414046 RepID=A0AAE3G1V5_9GAMM|nr:TlpA disulfide reductase family protein [Natronocella acetinitrilica]MCP1672913.1 peroxiredoxin [Natronocella acetinitrilica]